MSRSERFSNEREILNAMKDYVTGPVLKTKSGKYLVEGSEGHTLILGESGTGKTRREIIATIINSLLSPRKESWIIADPKGEIFANTIGHVSDDYLVFMFDFRSLYREGNTCWNPLAYPYELWASGTQENKFRAEQLVDDLAYAMFPVAPNTDPFWMTEARNLFEGAVFALFCYARPEEINLVSVFYLVQKGEEKRGASNFLKEFVELEEINENVSMQLYSYVSTANDTRAGIRSSFLSRLSMATKSESVRSFLSNDDIHINRLIGDRPVLIYVVLPDETPIYEDLAGVLIAQLMNHFIYIAETKWGGKLPIRMNVCLDELGNIGKAINKLPHLLSAGRSRNVRCHLCLQSLSQLDDVYGRSSATTILSNTSVKIAFRTNNWDTLSELSRLCGEKEIVVDGNTRLQPLITPTQLGAMETGQALIMCAGRLKFVTWLPDYTEMFDESINEKSQRYIGSKKRKKTVVFDIKRYVNEKMDNKIKKMLATEDQSKQKKDSVFRYFEEDLDSVDDLKDILESKVDSLADDDREGREAKHKRTAPKPKRKTTSSNEKGAMVIILNSVSKEKDICVISKFLKCNKSVANDIYEAGMNGECTEIRGLSTAVAHEVGNALEAVGDIVIVKE